MNQTPIDAVIQKLDSLIQAGSATAEQLEDLRMDLEDCKGGTTEETPEPSEGMSGMINKIQGGY